MKDLRQKNLSSVMSLHRIDVLHHRQQGDVRHVQMIRHLRQLEDQFPEFFRLDRFRRQVRRECGDGRRCIESGVAPGRGDAEHQDGVTQNTRTPCGRSSVYSPWLNFASPAFAAVYTLHAGQA